MNTTITTSTQRRINQHEAAYLKMLGYEVFISKSGNYMDFKVNDMGLALRDLEDMAADKSLMTYIGALRDLKKEMRDVQRKKDAADKQQPVTKAAVTAPLQSDAVEPLEQEASA